MDILSVKQRFGIIGTNKQLETAIDIAMRVASTDLSVLVTGESGVGKEFFPQIIQSFSSRKHKNYIAVNCGAIPEGTIDSELFGHEKGAFTGATDNRKGYFEMADGGTIFLDEVAELPLTTQVRLLRVLQTGEFIKVGSSKVQKTNVRVVAATNINLTQAISKGKFREDLYYRLNTVPISVPSLRERREDILTLFKRFTLDVAHQYKMPMIVLDSDAKELLTNYYWPGNIRQLKNVAEQISVIESKREIDATTLRKYLPEVDNNKAGVVVNQQNDHNFSQHSDRELLFTVLYDMRKDILELKNMVTMLSKGKVNVDDYPKNAPVGLLTAAPVPLSLPYKSEASYSTVDSGDNGVEVIVQEESAPASKEDYLRESIIKALEKHGGRRKDAAKELFISERTLYRRIKELGIDE